MGEDKALAFARKLATQNLRVQQGSSLLVQQMSAGEFNVLIDALHYQIENLKQRGAPVDYVIPDPLLIKDPSGIWLAKYSASPPRCGLPRRFSLYPRSPRNLCSAKSSRGAQRYGVALCAEKLPEPHPRVCRWTSGRPGTTSS